jgi:transcriptional antiterminator RfaH
MNWFVVYTKPQHELKVEKKLTNLGYKVYCPKTTQVRQWSDRKKKIITPLIKSYLFIKIDSSKRDEIFQVDGVIRYLYWLGKPAMVRDCELQCIENYLSFDKAKVAVQYLNVGDTTIIKEGIFENEEATIIRKNNNSTTVCLQSLGLLVTISF